MCLASKTVQFQYTPHPISLLVTSYIIMAHTPKKKKQKQIDMLLLSKGHWYFLSFYVMFT